MANVIDARVGAEPANVVWTLVRGDDAKISFQFLASDGVTPLNVSGWTYSAVAKTSSGVLESLTVTPGASSTVTIHATAVKTATWGTSKPGGVPADLSFDLQVTKADTTVWTPLIGTMRVLPDVR